MDTTTGREYKKQSGTCPHHIGGEYQPLHAEQLADPYSFFARARQEGPIFYSPALQAWVVTHHAEILKILKQPGIFSSRDVLRSLVTFSPQVKEILSAFPTDRRRIINMDGEPHRQTRSGLQSAFTRRRIDQLEPFIQATVDRLIDAFVQDGQTDIISSLAYPTPLTVVLHLLGIPEEMMAQCKEWSDHFLLLVSSMNADEATQIKYAQSYVAFCTYMLSLMEEKKRAPQEDLISELVTTGWADSPVREVATRLQGIVFAGHETTTNLIGNGLRLLLEDQTRWQALCDQPELIPLAIEEVLRYDSPVHGFFRTANQDVTIGEHTIRAGEQILLVYGSANHDEQHFQNSSQFDIHRFATSERLIHLAFGYGVHFCPGAVLARLEARIALTALAKRLPELRLAADHEIQNTPALIFRGYKQLFVEWNAQHAS